MVLWTRVGFFQVFLSAFIIKFSSRIIKKIFVVLWAPYSNFYSLITFSAQVLFPWHLQQYLLSKNCNGNILKQVWLVNTFKNIPIWSFSGPDLLVFRQNTEMSSRNLLIQPEYRNPYLDIWVICQSLLVKNSKKSDIFLLWKKFFYSFKFKSITTQSLKLF